MGLTQQGWYPPARANHADYPTEIERSTSSALTVKVKAGPHNIQSATMRKGRAAIKSVDVDSGMKKVQARALPEGNPAAA